MKKLTLVILISALFILSACNEKKEAATSHTKQSTVNTSQTTKESLLSNSISTESTENMNSGNTMESTGNINSDGTKNSDEITYPKITKELINGKSWYEGNSTGVENQPREGFYENKFQDLFGNELDYEIIIDDNEQTYRVFDFRRDEQVDIKLKTKIKVNKPTVDGTYRDVYYYLYYKYDGTLMIARKEAPSEKSDLTSYPLE